MRNFLSVGFLALVFACFVAAANSDPPYNETPTCALLCEMQLIPQSNCSLTDIPCICQNTVLDAQIAACIQGNCTIKEQLIAKNVSMATCGQPLRNKTKAIWIPGIVGCILAIVAVILRMLARLTTAGGQFGMDDYVLLVAMLAVIPFSGLSVVLARDGLGKDIWNVPFDKISNILYVYFFDESMYLAAMGLIKISILFFYLRIFPDKDFRKIVYVVMGLCVAYSTSFILVSVFQCRPVNLAWRRWDGMPKGGHCNNINAQGWCSAVFNIVLDVIVIVLPMRQLSKLALTWRKKVGVMLMFSVGFFITIVSMLRLKSLIQFANTDNLTWDYVDMGYWSTVEVHVSVICACMPSIRALMRKIWPAAFRMTEQGKSSLTHSRNVSTGMRTPQISFKPKQDEEDFVQLVDMEGGDIKRPIYSSETRTTSDRSAYSGKMGIAR